MDFFSLNYFSSRVNISSSVSRADVSNFLKLYPTHVCAFEGADKEVKNDHCHIVIWGEGAVDYLTEEYKLNWTTRLKEKCPGAKGNGRFSTQNEHKGSLQKALQYVCKGTVNTQPDIISFATITPQKIEECWLAYWGENLKSQKKKQEDTSGHFNARLWNAKSEFISNYVWTVPAALRRITVWKYWLKEYREICVEELKSIDFQKMDAACNMFALKTLGTAEAEIMDDYFLKKHRLTEITGDFDGY